MSDQSSRAVARLQMHHDPAQCPDGGCQIIGLMARAEAAERALAVERATSHSLREDVIKELGRMLAVERERVAQSREVLREYARTCDPAPYTSERALFERVTTALAEHEGRA